MINVKYVNEKVRIEEKKRRTYYFDVSPTSESCFPGNETQ